jgi:hypothetical protein
MNKKFIIFSTFLFVSSLTVFMIYVSIFGSIINFYFSLFFSFVIFSSILLKISLNENKN